MAIPTEKVIMIIQLIKLNVSDTCQEDGWRFNVHDYEMATVKETKDEAAIVSRWVARQAPIIKRRGT